MKPQPDTAKKTKRNEASAPRPSQSQVDDERGDWEGMAQSRFQPKLVSPSTDRPRNLSKVAAWSQAARGVFVKCGAAVRRAARRVATRGRSYPGRQAAQTVHTPRMINANQIKPHAPVVCSDNGQFAVVDHMEGTDTIKLAKDAKGQHHYIPMSWVKSVDDKVHLDRPGDQAMREWQTSPTGKT